MDPMPLTDWFANIYHQSETTIAVVLDMLRRDGQDAGDYVVVVADMRDDATRFFVDQLGDGASDPAMPGFVGAIRREVVAKTLAMLGSESLAGETTKPVEPGRMRVLVAARGQLQCADLVMLPPLAPGGTA